MTLKINAAFPESGILPGRNIVEQIGNAGVAVNWWRFSAAHVTIETDKVATIRDMYAPDTVTMVQANTARRAALASAALGAYAAGLFVKAYGAAYSSSGLTFSAAAPFTLIGTFRRVDLDAENQVLCGINTGSTGFWLGFAAGTPTALAARWGSVTTPAITVDDDDWHWYMCEYDGTNVRLQVDGGDWVSIAAAGTPATGLPLVWGSSSNASTANAWDGYMSDLIHFADDVSGNAPIMAAIEEYMADILQLAA